ncbi:MAG: hypothetical protein HYR96_16085 [Deltaproteobacteria bacterium]|nr:hypothetical protein [Deltaproteobacteria bacterium]MBI3293236.1 hypothetical protein [Deltaproteobacteria bacterium]
MKTTLIIATSLFLTIRTVQAAAPQFECTLEHWDLSGTSIVSQKTGLFSAKPGEVLSLEVDGNEASLGWDATGPDKIHLSLSESHCSAERFFSALLPKGFVQLPDFSFQIDGVSQEISGQTVSQDFRFLCRRLSVD